ncbi:MAG: Flp pilus assembly complex ATPase component TadA [Firmicutes bacterium]|nr:Flp pilus assembly complex ATPase component TadA [Bacillota bacterium]
MDFDFNEYIRKEDTYVSDGGGFKSFYELCAKVKDAFFKDWEKNDQSAAMLEIQKKAIIGYEKEKCFFLERIGQIIEDQGFSDTAFPHWYTGLVDAVYQENWGLAGISQWFTEEYRGSSSAKIIGERIYFMEGGRMVLKSQTISSQRKEQLIRAFLLMTPGKRFDRDYYEIYLLDGTRVTVYLEPMAKDGQSSLVLRRYLIPSLSFEEQARRKTIPSAAIPLFKAMVNIGYNVVFMGAVRTAKTTFLATWQSGEREDLEGVLIETDPEIPIHEILPKAPIIQLLADGEDLRNISKNLLRSDADYFILAEARDGIALDTAVKLACKGTKRMKMTFHSRNPEHFPLEAATEIVKTTGGDLPLTMQMVSSAFDYLFHFVQLSDKSQKRLKGIYQMNCDEMGTFHIEQICAYDHESESWSFKNVIGKEQRVYGSESDPDAFRIFERKLEELSKAGQLK